jgi:hypothetical protein
MLKDGSSLLAPRLHSGKLPEEKSPVHSSQCDVNHIRMLKFYLSGICLKILTQFLGFFPRRRGVLITMMM